MATIPIPPDGGALDPDLGEQLSGGNPNVLRGLATYLLDRAVRLRLRAVCGLDANEIDDVVAVTLFKIWENRASYDCRRPLAPWCDAILRRVAVDAVRKRNRQLPGRTPLPLTVAAPLPDQEAGSDLADANPLSSLLAGLSPVDRRILEAHANDPNGPWAANLAVELSSTGTSISASSIRVRRLRLVQKLRKAQIEMGLSLSRTTEINHATTSKRREILDIEETE